MALSPRKANGHIETRPQVVLGLHNISVSNDDAEHEYPEQINMGQQLDSDDGKPRTVAAQAEPGAV